MSSLYLCPSQFSFKISCYQSLYYCPISKKWLIWKSYENLSLLGWLALFRVGFSFVFFIFFLVKNAIFRDRSGFSFDAWKFNECEFEKWIWNFVINLSDETRSTRSIDEVECRVDVEKTVNLNKCCSIDNTERKPIPKRKYSKL